LILADKRAENGRKKGGKLKWKLSNLPVIEA